MTYYTLLYYTMLYYAALYHTILLDTILYYYTLNPIFGLRFTRGSSGFLVKKLI